MLEPDLGSWFAAGVQGLVVAGLLLVSVPARTVLPDGVVRFESGSSVLTPESASTLERLAEILKKRPELDPVMLVGHADDRGDAATNEQLSKQRADVVRGKLVELGIRRSRLQVDGMGSTQPLVAGNTDEARRTNRRVEVWVTSLAPVARVARIEREVLAKRAAAPEWVDAQIDMPLRRRAQVRTMKSSSSEIRFGRRDKVSLGPQSLVVIFGSPKKTKRSKRSTADIQVQRGSIFASLAKREGRTLQVDANSARVDVTSTNTRVDVREGSEDNEETSTVSVFEGRSTVAAAGRVVAVERGYGTRVRRGAAPEPPRPLPIAPTWVGTGALTHFAGNDLGLEWTPRTAVEIQIGAWRDETVSRPIRLVEADGTSAYVAGLKPGIYRVRLAAIDDRGIRGSPGGVRTLVVWPSPKGALFEKGTLRLSVPGVVTLAAPDGSRVATRSKAPVDTLALDLLHPGTSRRHVVVTSTSGATVVRSALVFEVPTATIALAAEVPKREGASVRTTVWFAVTSNGRPVSSLDLVARPVSDLTPRLVVTSSAALKPCFCEAPKDGVGVIDLGDGQYRFELELASSRRPTAVRVVDRRGGLAAELHLDVPPLPTPVGHRRAGRTGWFGSLSAGARLGGEDAPRIRLAGEAGRRVLAYGPLHLDLAAQLGWFRVGASDPIDVIPLMARGTIAWRFGAPRVYVGAGLGLRFASDDEARAAGQSFAGFGYALGDHAEVLVEGGFDAIARHAARDERLAGFQLGVALRLGTFGAD